MAGPDPRKVLFGLLSAGQVIGSILSPNESLDDMVGQLADNQERQHEITAQRAREMEGWLSAHNPPAAIDDR